MECSVDRLVEALVGVEAARERRAKEDRSAAASRHTYVVTVSRGYGALGTETAQSLADTLGVTCCDRNILQEVARRANVDNELVRKLDERVSHIGNDWWKALFTERTCTRERYFQHLVKVILNISIRGGVIVGRGAHLILGPGHCFRVRVVGSPENCARRVSEREGIGVDAARQRIDEVDRERAEYIRELYGEHAGDSRNFDLTLNTDTFTVDQAVALILEAMHRAGYELTPEILKAARS